MNTKEYANLNDEILIGETNSEELADQDLDSVTGGLSLNFTKITYNSISFTDTTLKNSLI